MKSKIFIHVTIIIGLYAASAYAQQVLNLLPAVQQSCAIVRGQPVYLGESSFHNPAAYLGESSFHNPKKGYETKLDSVWALDVTEVYRWKLPKWRGRGLPLVSPDAIPRRIIFVAWGLFAIRKYDEEVVVFLKCGCRDGYIFTLMGYPLDLYEDWQGGVKSKFIAYWVIPGLGTGNIPLEDFAKAVKREEKKRWKPKKFLDYSTFEILD